MCDLKENSFINEAIEIAASNVNDGGGPFGALIVRDGKVVGRGANQVTRTNDPSAHAEVVAIRDACKNLQTFKLEGCTIYSSCEPCPMCLGAIYWARLDKLFFAATQTDAARAGFDDSFIYKEFELKPEDRALYSRNLKVESFFKPFATWLEHEQKTEY